MEWFKEVCDFVNWPGKDGAIRDGFKLDPAVLPAGLVLQSVSGALVRPEQRAGIAPVHRYYDVKSETAAGHAINLLDSPDEIRNKIMRATTDSLREIRFDASRPGIFNLLTIYHLFSKQSQKEIEAQFEGKGYSDFKKALAEVVVEGLRPLQERYKELTADPTRIDSALTDAANRARPIAEKLLAEVRKKVGLG